MVHAGRIAARPSHAAALARTLCAVLYLRGEWGDVYRGGRIAGGGPVNEFVAALLAVPTPAQMYAQKVRTSEAYHFSGCLPPLEAFGLAIQSSGGNPLPLTTDVLSLRIFEVL
jgi:hypothetical protein